MDMDGANLKTLAGGGVGSRRHTAFFAIGPSRFAYMSFGRGRSQSDVAQSRVTGQREACSATSPECTFAPRFSTRWTSRIEVDVGSRRARAPISIRFALALARRRGSPTPPESTPLPLTRRTARSIAFEFDRGGTQQIYVMTAGGGSAKRISFGQGRPWYSTPVWFTARRPNRLHPHPRADPFGIGVMKPDGSGERIPVVGLPQRRPFTFAPNGPLCHVLPRSSRSRAARRST